MPNPKSEIHKNGKKAKERRFGFMLATGKTQVEAYSAVFNVEGLSTGCHRKAGFQAGQRDGG